MLYGNEVNDVSFGAIFLSAGMIISPIDGDGLYEYDGRTWRNSAFDLLINWPRTGVFSWICQRKSMR